MKILFLHGLEGSTEGVKASYLREKYNAMMPELDTSELRNLKEENGGNWELIDRYDALWASRIPLKQTREAIEKHKPDLIIGSSLGGALLAKIVIENAWSGPCVFLASASKLLFDIVKIPLAVGQKSYWIHGSSDSTVPLDDSIEMTKSSGGHLEVVDDSHRLEKLVELGSLDDIIATLEKQLERSVEESLE